MLVQASLKTQLLLASAAIFVWSAGGIVARAQQDVLQTVVARGIATPTPTSAIGAFGYSSSSNTFYTVSFGATAELRKITADPSGVFNITEQMAGPSGLQYYARAGNPGWGGNPVMSALVMNPKPIGTRPAESFAVMNDAIGVLTSSASSTPPNTKYPELTARIFSFNLQPTVAGDPTLYVPGPGEEQRGLGSFQTIATKSAFATAAGTDPLAGDNTGRQFAWSSDGQSIYTVDSLATAGGSGGIYRVAIETGAVSRLFAGGDINTEPAIRSLGGGVGVAGGQDRIYFRGTAGTSNAGGVSFIDYDGTVATAPQSLFSAADIRNALHMPASMVDPDIRSMASDDGGNLYLWDLANLKLLRVDVDNHISVVMTKDQRQQIIGTPAGVASLNSNVLRMQPREITYTNPTTLQEFEIPQILYAESSSGNIIAGVNIFLPADLNRDNDVTSNDLALLETVLLAKAAVPTPAFSQDDWKFDLNGDTKVDTNDVLVLSQFTTIVPGDADLNGVTDFADLGTLLNLFNQPGNWRGGDFDGNALVDFSDLGILLNNYSYVSETSGGAQAVPEPGSIWLLAIGAMLAGCGCVRRRMAWSRGG